MNRYRVAIFAYLDADDEDHAVEQLEDLLRSDFQAWCYTVPVDENDECTDEIDYMHVGCSRK
jgi:hypothetical protein